jgi:hypothetical protein
METEILHPSVLVLPLYPIEEGTEQIPEQATIYDLDFEDGVVVFYTSNGAPVSYEMVGIDI